jgi:phage-related baseplate assembly protein
MAAGFPSLPTPVFLNDADGLNPNLILTDLIVSFQPAGGCILQPAQMERLIINLVVYREALIRNQIQHIGQQILLTFATFPMLDYLGAVRSVTRLAAEPALTTLQFNLTNALTVSFDVPKGTLVGTSDGLLTFAISADLIIPAVATQGSVAAACTRAGIAGNRYLAGQIATLVNPNVLISSVSNTITSSGSSAQETEDHYRVRIQAAPNQFSFAGLDAAYMSDRRVVPCRRSLAIRRRMEMAKVNLYDIV